MSYTREPWCINSNGDIIEGDDELVYVISTERDKANARRIVACVNACAGISTGALENTSNLDELYNTIAKERDVEMARRVMAEHQRDELFSLVGELKMRMQKVDELLDADIVMAAYELQQAIQKCEGKV